VSGEANVEISTGDVKDAIPVVCVQCGSKASLDPKSLVCPACLAKEAKASRKRHPEQHPTHKIAVTWPPGIAINVEGLEVDEVWGLYQKVLQTFQPKEGQKPEVKRAIDQFVR